MAIAQDVLETLQSEPELVESNGEEIQWPPGDLESQEPPLESYLHLQQLILLLNCLDWLWQDRDDYFATGNLSIYYSPEQKKSQDVRGPDFFVVLGTEHKPRKSWVVWEEGGKYPNVIIELLSDSTQKVDRTEKKQIYQDIFRTPDYFWFSPDTLELKGFHLLDGEYEDIQPNERGQLWSKQLELFLGVHEGKLRFFTSEGELVPTPQEAAQIAQEIAQTEKQQRVIAEQKVLEAETAAATEKQQRETTEQQLEIERQQKEKLAAKLRELNIDPDAL